MKRELLYEGKAKRVYQSEDATDQLILVYKNNTTAFNGQKKEQIAGKGRLNNAITALVFACLREQGFETHFIEKRNEMEQLVWKTDIIPLEIVVRNIAAGSITTRLGLTEKTPFSPAIVELFYKDDTLNDPLINDQHAYMLTDVTEAELTKIKKQALSINTQLQTLFRSIHLTLVDFKLEFGRTKDGDIIVADEISPDTCRLWDMKTQEKMDKDVFRQGTGDLVDIYQKVLQRLESR